MTGTPESAKTSVKQEASASRQEQKWPTMPTAFFYFFSFFFFLPFFAAPFFYPLSPGT
jgi:hypothetical protein